VVLNLYGFKPNGIWVRILFAVYCFDITFWLALFFVTLDSCTVGIADFFPFAFGAVGGVVFFAFEAGPCLGGIMKMTPRFASFVDCKAWSKSDRFTCSSGRRRQYGIGLYTSSTQVRQQRHERTLQRTLPVPRHITFFGSEKDDSGHLREQNARCCLCSPNRRWKVASIYCPVSLWPCLVYSRCHCSPAIKEETYAKALTSGLHAVDYKPGYESTIPLLLVSI